ncbi:hypothetical protein GCM10011371_14330 [Novosphingobium marinum]|uniref:Uncharacterized protein n=1 Tax=Novosphingobium marinum TaxID=1514948 RepID=A0A7Y9XVU3_9SPHN|nr:hypothetical protein [Novosphingobium marinum]NYH95546.1 hypothetical protein [Novosphingobium marinum]GGC27924.1 hypothetical protein GCM10011371_14330 [Novosphingobium marinum]
MNAPRPRSAWKRFCRISPDWVFGAMLVLVPLVIARDWLWPASDGDGSDPRTLALLFAITLGCGIVAAIASRFDRRMIEDFHYRLMANGAIVGIVAMMTVVIVFDVLVGDVDALTGKDIILVLTTGWAIGYFYHRLRGLDA